MKENTCPLVPWYKFKGKCSITTCQNNTTRTLTGCLALDRPERSDKITDTELLHYKVIPNKEKLDSQTMDTKYTSYIRKKYVSSVKSNMVYYLYVMYIQHNYKPHSKFTYIKGVSGIIDNILHSFPFNQKEAVFEPWMIVYAANPKIFKLFLSKQQRSTGETINLVSVLGLTPGKYKNICHAIKEYPKKLKELSKKTQEIK